MRRTSRRGRTSPQFEILETRTLLSVTPNDTYYSQQWGLNNANNVDIDAPQAWGITTGSSSVIVADIGSGVDLTNPDLVNRIWTNPNPNSGPYVGDLHGWNFETDTPTITDSSGHDTNVAGIMVAQTNNSQGVAGVTWGPTLMTLVAGNNLEDAQAVYFAVANGAKVINMSFDYPEAPSLVPNDSLYQAIQLAANSGVVVVAAAGNDGQDLSTDDVSPAQFRLPNMINVAELDSNGSLDSASNYGATTVDLAAPGSNIYTTGLNGGYISWASGTSFAAPFVTGVVALVQSEFPSLSAQQDVQLVVNNTKAESSLSGKTISGGMVDAYNSLLAGFSIAGYANPTASASPGTVTASTSTLSVSDPYGSGDADLTYTWNVTSVPSGATPPSYNSNGKSTTVTFHAAGNYTFLATIADGDGFQKTASVSVTVNQTATSITISPATATVPDSNTEAFSALVYDQFGAAISSPSLSWSVNAGGVGGTINQSSGLYTAPTSGAGTDTVKVASGQASATASVTVTSTPTPTSTSPIFVDDSQLGNGFSTSGNWIQWGGGYDNTDSTAQGGNGSSTATWTFNNLTPGQYEVWTTWVQAPNRATNSPFTVYDGSNALASVDLNQTQVPVGYYDQGFSWNTLGERFNITTGQLKVTLTNNVASGRYVDADAVRIRRLGPWYVDDSQPGNGFSASSGWQQWTGSGGYDNSYSTAPGGSGSTSATWTFNNLPLGTYEVWTTWVQAPNRATNSPFTVYDGTNSLATVPINQSQAPTGYYAQGFAWDSLGESFNITSGTLVVKLTNSGVASNLNVVADAVRINRVGPYYADDSDGTGIFGDTGNWTQWQGSSEGYDNTDSTAPGGNSPSSATWTFTNLVPGVYDVWATWVQAPNRATNSPFSIYDNSNLLSTVLVNQVPAPSGYYDQGFSWSTLGESFSITSGTLIVELTNSGVSSNQLYVVADAIRINRLGSLSGSVVESFAVIAGPKRPSAQGPRTAATAQSVIGTVPSVPRGATVAFPVLGTVLSGVYGWVENDPASPTAGVSGLASVARPGKDAGQPAERPPQGADLRRSAKLPLSGPVLSPPDLERVFDELISRKTQPAILARWNLFSAD